MSYIKKFMAMRLAEPIYPEPVNKMFSSIEEEFKLISKGMAGIGKKVAVDAEATPGYLGALASDGALRVNSPLTYADGGNFVTLDLDESLVDHALLGGVSADQHHPQAHTLASHSTKPHSALTGVTSDQHHAQLHETAHRSGGGDELNHDLLVGFVAGEHLVLPNTIASVLSDHDKTAHDALGLDHGALSGKGDDDHSQYHNDTRGDIRYYTKTLLDGGQLDTRYYTESEINTLLLAMNEFKELTDTPANYTGYGDYVVAVKSTEDGLEFVEAPQPGVHALVGDKHSVSGLTIGHVVRASGATSFAWAQLQHSDLGGVTSDLHHPQAHTLASHSSKAHSELTGVTSDQHHAQLHAAEHEKGGGDLIGTLGDLTVDGTLIVDTDTGNQPFYVTRLGVASQCGAFWVDDYALYIASRQDENLASLFGNIILRIGNQALQTPIFEIQNYTSGSPVSLLKLTHDDQLILGSSPSIKWLSGNLLLQTDYLTNSNTYIDIKGKGTGYGATRIFNEADTEWLQIDYSCIRTMGASPPTLLLQYGVPADIQCFHGITSGNPWFWWHGYETGVGLKYFKLNINSAGHTAFHAERSLLFRTHGSDLFYMQDGYAQYLDNIVLAFGEGVDYGMGYHEPTDSFQIVDGVNLNSNIRAKLPSNGYWEFYNKIGIGGVPASKLHIPLDSDSAGQLRIGTTGGGRSAVFGQRMYQPGSETLQYSAYWAYDAYFDNSDQTWKPVRDSLGGKWKAEFSYHLQDYRISYSAGYNPISWTDVFIVRPGGEIEALLNVKTPKITIGSYYLNSLIANNRVPDSAKLTASGFVLDALIADDEVPNSDRWNGHQMPSLSNEKVLYNNGSALSWERLNFDWLSDVNIDAFITPFEACLLCYDQNGSQWVAGRPEYDIRYKSYQIEWEFWDASPPSPWASGTLNGGTATVSSGDDHPGYCIVKTRFDGDATNSGYYWVAANDRISVGGLEQMDFVFKTPSSLTGKRWRLGFQDSITVAAPVDGIYLEMSADAIIRGVNRSNNSQETTGTTYTLSTATWYRARISVSSGATAVTFKIYSEAGTQLWSQTLLTTQYIPTGINRAVGFGVVAWLNFDDNLENIIILDLADLICARGLER